ncbi:MAG: metal-dependent hydrolase [Acidobacteria bacterium]|nr:metal-dependent hydrolase [Acidobacteriota bacterium]
MDPLAHTLTGANLAATRLGGKSRLAAAALVIGANAPDIDAILYFTGHRDLALGFRRGWTHGVLALVVLPLILTGLLLLYDRLRPDPERRADPKWLLLLSAIATLTHPTLDWLNTYGMRWLMPFRPTWFYGDSVNIMDPWIWLILGIGWLVGRRPTIAMVALWAIFTFLILRIVGGRAPEYLVLVAMIAVILLLALLWRGPARNARLGARFATTALIVTTLYICSRLLINAAAGAEVERQLEARGIVPVRVLMLSPHPIDPRAWSFVARNDDLYRVGTIEWPGGEVELSEETLPVAKESPEWRAARRDPSIRGFMTWVRFPSYVIERTGGETRVLIYDARRATGSWPSPRIVTLKP